RQPRPCRQDLRPDGAAAALGFEEPALELAEDVVVLLVAQRVPPQWDDVRDVPLLGAARLQPQRRRRPPGASAQLSNYPRIDLKALILHKLEERRSRRGGSNHDRNPTEAQTEEGPQTQTAGNDLGSARSPLGACPAHPPRVLADQGL